MKTTKTTCCVYGCSKAAVEFAAPNVPYCSAHASANRRATGVMQQQQTSANLDNFIRGEASRAIILAAEVRADGTAVSGGREYEVVVGTQYDREVVAVCDQAYLETSYGEAIFLDRRSERYAEFRAVAKTAK